MAEAIWTVWLALAPWLLVGAAVAGALHALLPPGLLRRKLAGRGGVVRAVLFGAPLPLCSCGVIPTGLGLKKQGAGDGATVAFLISTPQTGVDSILVTNAMLGLPLTLWKVFCAVVTGLVGGWWANAVGATTAGEVSDAASPETDAAGRPGVWEGVLHAVEMVRSTWLWVLVGVLVSAALTVCLPAQSLAALGEYGGLPAMLAALVISLPLYVCATASVPIAASLVAAGLPTGAAVVLLMAGPATNVATIGAVYRTLGAKQLTVYLTTIIAGSIVGGLLFEWLLPGQGPSNAIATHAHHQHGEGLWATLSGCALAALFVWFAIERLRRSITGPVLTTDAVTVAVEGMTCGGCVSKLERTVAADPLVESVNVSLKPGSVTAAGSLTIDQLRALVKDAGFSPG
ncbi:MAG: permease [Planctomycetota bacterium]